MPRTLDDACLHSGTRYTLSPVEADSGWVRCIQCGRMLRVQPVFCDGEWDAAVPWHNKAAPGYLCLADAAAATDTPGYGHGPATVWYARNPTFRSADTQLTTLPDTHVKVGNFDSKDPDAVYHAMQGECWSPDGQARDLIKSLGLQHTSMSVGDAVEIDGAYYVCAGLGWRKLPAED